MENKIALFIDSENVNVKFLKPLLDELIKRGDVNLRYYFDRLIRIKSTTLYDLENVNSLGFTIVPVSSSNKLKKNACDIALTIKVMETLNQNPGFNTFCIASSDSDFLPLVLKIKSQNVSVIIAGQGQIINNQYLSKIDDYIDVDKLKSGLAEASVPTPTITKARSYQTTSYKPAETIKPILQTVPKVIVKPLLHDIKERSLDEVLGEYDVMDRVKQLEPVIPDEIKGEVLKEMEEKYRMVHEKERQRLDSNKFNNENVYFTKMIEVVNRLQKKSITTPFLATAYDTFRKENPDFKLRNFNCLKARDFFKRCPDLVISQNLEDETNKTEVQISVRK